MCPHMAHPLPRTDKAEALAERAPCGTVYCCRLLALQVAGAYICPRTTTICPHTTIHVSSYSAAVVSWRCKWQAGGGCMHSLSACGSQACGWSGSTSPAGTVLLYACSHTATYVSSYCYICVLKLSYVSPYYYICV
jgi:hypothetical protein